MCTLPPSKATPKYLKFPNTRSAQLLLHTFFLSKGISVDSWKQKLIDIFKFRSKSTAVEVFFKDDGEINVCAKKKDAFGAQISVYNSFKASIPTIKFFFLLFEKLCLHNFKDNILKIDFQEDCINSGMFGSRESARKSFSTNYIIDGFTSRGKIKFEKNDVSNLLDGGESLAKLFLVAHGTKDGVEIELNSQFNFLFFTGYNTLIPCYWKALHCARSLPLLHLICSTAKERIAHIFPKSSSVTFEIPYDVLEAALYLPDKGTKNISSDIKKPFFDAIQEINLAQREFFGNDDLVLTAYYDGKVIDIPKGSITKNQSFENFRKKTTLGVSINGEFFGALRPKLEKAN